MLAGLPPGTYRVYAEPFDGPDTNWIGGVFGLGADQQFVDKDFTPVFFSEEITMTAGQTVADVELLVGRRDQYAPNLDLHAWLSDAARGRVDPALMLPGTNAIMELAPGENILTDQGLAPGTRFSFAGDGVTITRIDARSTIGLRLAVAPDAPPGPRLLQVTTQADTAFLSGALTVVSDLSSIQPARTGPAGRFPTRR